MKEFVGIYFANLVDFASLHVYLSAFCEHGEMENKTNKVFVVGFAVLLALVNIYKISIFYFLIYIALIYIYSFLYKLARLYYIVLPILYFVLGVGVKTLGVLIVNGINKYFSQQTACYIAIFVGEIIRCYFVALVILSRRIILSKVSRKVKMLVYSILIFCFSIYCIIIYVVQKHEVGIGTILCLIIFLLTLCVNVLIFIIITELCEIMRENYRNKLLLYEAQAKEEYYVELENINKAVQEIKHNLIYKIFIILTKNSRDMKYALEEMVGELKSCDKKICTVNPVLNSILNSKIQNAEEKGITSTLYIDIPMQINVDYFDLGILIGNLFDNAIEACEKIQTNDRWIILHLSYKNKIFIFQIVNSKSCVDIYTGKSSKKDYVNHGIGLKSIKKIVKKYNGEIDLRDTGKTFEVSGVLYGITFDKIV